MVTSQGVKLDNDSYPNVLNVQTIHTNFFLRQFNFKILSFEWQKAFVIQLHN